MSRPLTLSLVNCFEWSTDSPAYCVMDYCCSLIALCLPLQAVVQRAGHTPADAAERVQGQQTSVHGERGAAVETAQWRPAGQSPSSLTHLPLQLAQELGLLPHSCTLISQITWEQTRATSYPDTDAPHQPWMDGGDVWTRAVLGTDHVINLYSYLKYFAAFGTDALRPEQSSHLTLCLPLKPGSNTRTYITRTCRHTPPSEDCLVGLLNAQALGQRCGCVCGIIGTVPLCLSFGENSGNHKHFLTGFVWRRDVSFPLWPKSGVQSLIFSGPLMDFDPNETEHVSPTSTFQSLDFWLLCISSSQRLPCSFYYIECTGHTHTHTQLLLLHKVKVRMLEPVFSSET